MHCFFSVRRAKKTVSRIITEVSGSTTSSVSQRGRRRSAKKYWKIEENADPRDAAEAAGESADWDVNDDIKEHVVSEVAENDDSTCGKMGLNGYFEFELLPIHTAKNRLGRKMFQCDVCSGVYRHCFSLKRHYLRNHINRRYISRVDALNCNITFFEPEEEEKSAAVNNGAKTDKRDDERGPVEPQDSSPRVKAASGRNDKNSEKEGKEKEEEEVVTTLQLDVEEIGSNDVTESTAKAVRGRKSSAAGAMHLPGLFRCYVCEKLFDKVGSLKSHFSENHASGADKRFACRHCQMQFKHRQNLVRHEVVHSGKCRRFGHTNFAALNGNNYIVFEFCLKKNYDVLTFEILRVFQRVSLSVVCQQLFAVLEKCY